MNEQLLFLQQILQTIVDNQFDIQSTYPLLRMNFSRLDKTFAQALRQWAMINLPQMSLEESEVFAVAISKLSIFISELPEGNRADHLEVAIAGHEIITTIFTRESSPEHWAITQVNLCNDYYTRSRGSRTENLENAIAAGRSALEIFTCENFPHVWAIASNNLGNAYKDRIKGERAKNIETAIALYQAALQVHTRESFPEQWSLLQNNLGEAYRIRILGNKSENLEQAISYYKNILQIYTPDYHPEIWASAQGNLGIAYNNRIQGSRSDNLNQALQHHEAALQIYTPENFPYDWALNKKNMGNVYKNRIDGNRSENLEQAISNYQEALQIFTRNNYPAMWAEVHNDLGIAYQDRIQGDRVDNIELAIAAYQLALQVYTLDEFPDEWARTHNNLANAYQDRIRGDRQDNLEEAIKSYKLALNVWTYEDFPWNWALVQNNLGSLYKGRIYGDRSDNLEQAITAFNNALMVWTYEDFPKYWARNQSSLANVFIDRIQGKPDENLEHAFKSCEMALKFLSYDSEPQEWATTLLVLGNVYSKRASGDKIENQNRAIASYKSASQVYSRENFPQEWAILQNNSASSYYEQGKIDEAIEAYRLALEVFTPSIDPINCCNSAGGLGNIAFQSGRWSEAIEGYSLAIAAIERRRNWTNARSRKQELLEDAVGLYSNIVQALINSGEPIEALAYVERCKVRGLIERIADRNFSPKYNIPERVLERFHQVQRDIDLEKQLLAHKARCFIRDEDNTEVPILVSRDYTRLQQLYQELNQLVQQEIQVYDPSFRLNYAIEVVSFAEIQQLLLNHKTALIEWFFGEETFTAFIITQHSPKPIVWQSSAQDFQALKVWANEYSNFYYKHWEQWQAELSNRLEQLARIIHLEEILNLLPKTCNQLILIPYRSLHLFPLHALPLSDGSCLLDHFSNGVRYAPSCQLLKLSQQRGYHDLNHLFAIQNPTEDLIYADLEVQTIKQYFHSYNILSRNKAERLAINSPNLSRADCIHFACHGFFNLQLPMLSGLSLSGSTVNSPITNDLSEYLDLMKRYLPLSNGKSLDLSKCFTLIELLDQDLSCCRLVTLSACETGLSDFSGLSDEYVGLPSGFLVAGAASIVSSLWMVNDLSTALLMAKFYENLQTETSISIALNQAQIWLRDSTKSELEIWADDRLLLDATMKINLRRRFYGIAEDSQPFRSPFYWSGFCAIGQ